MRASYTEMAGRCWVRSSLTLGEPAVLHKGTLTQCIPEPPVNRTVSKEGACLCVKLAVPHPPEERLGRRQPRTLGPLSLLGGAVFAAARRGPGLVD